MPKGLLIVLTNPSAPEREQEFNDWYDRVHLPEVLAVAGFCNARRYRRVDGTAKPQEPSYIAVYDIEADNVMAPIHELQRRSRAGEIHQSDALQSDPPPISMLYEQLP